MIDAVPPDAMPILDLVRDYRGLPISYRDIEDILGMHRRKAAPLVEPLIARGLVEVTLGEYREILIRDPIAWRDTVTP